MLVARCASVAHYKCSKIFPEFHNKQLYGHINVSVTQTFVANLISGPETPANSLRTLLLSVSTYICAVYFLPSFFVCRDCSLQFLVTWSPNYHPLEYFPHCLFHNRKYRCRAARQQLKLWICHCQNLHNRHPRVYFLNFGGNVHV